MSEGRMDNIDNGSGEVKQDNGGNLRWEHLPPVGKVKRSNAISHRAGNPLIHKLQKELHTMSLDQQPNPQSPTHIAVKRSSGALPPQSPSDSRDLRSPGMGMPADGDSANWDGIRKLPKVLLACVRGGMTASEIGQYLHRIVDGCDPSLSGIVTRMISSHKPYHEIGHYALKCLDLRNDHGDPLYQDVEIGDPLLRANPGLPKRKPVPINTSRDTDMGPSSPTEWAFEHICSEENDDDGDDNEEEDDEDWDINVASLLTCSIHKAKPIVVGGTTSQSGGKPE